MPKKIQLGTFQFGDTNEGTDMSAVFLERGRISTELDEDRHLL